MSNKAWNRINPLDKLIRQTLSLGMYAGPPPLEIKFVYGFELFNTRPYHNYETWSGGYHVKDHVNDIFVIQEDLDDALNEWAALVAKVKAGEELHYSKRFKHLLTKETNCQTPNINSQPQL